MVKEKTDNNEQKVKKKRGRKPKPKTAEDLKPKIKKKRGRKPKPKTAEDLKPKVKKKRGRKPKPKTAEDLKPKVKKKRGRKPKHKIYTVNTKKIQPTNIDNNNIIIHIPLKMNEFKNNKKLFENQKNVFQYNPNLSIPLEYEPKKINNIPIDNVYNFNSKDGFNVEPLSTQYSNYPQSLKKTKLLTKDNNFEIKNNNTNNNESINNKNNNNNLNSTFLINEDCSLSNSNKNDSENKFVNYEDIIEDIKNTTKKNKIDYKPLNKKIYNINTIFGDKGLENWPRTTQIHCFWDCHPFNNVPIAIPLKIEDNVYHVYGCFCSLECAAAYIFKNYENKWELYSLLHVFYNQTEKIRIASSRESLQIFGGILNINKFRSLNSTKLITHKLVMPPFLSIIPVQKEEKCNVHKENNSYNKYKYIPVDQEKLNKANESLRLKRSKPVKKNALELCMNLKYV